MEFYNIWFQNRRQKGGIKSNKVVEHRYKYCIYPIITKLWITLNYQLKTNCQNGIKERTQLYTVNKNPP